MPRAGSGPAPRPAAKVSGLEGNGLRCVGFDTNSPYLDRHFHDDGHADGCQQFAAARLAAATGCCSTGRMFEVTDAELTDLPVIAGWYASEWSDPTHEERILGSLRDRLAHKKIYAMKVVRDGERLAAVACLQDRDMGDRHPAFSPWLAGVYVEQEYRHKGIGLLLSKAIVQEARNQDFELCYLFTDKMEVWYREQGWQLLGRETYKDKQVAVMKIEL